MNRTNLLVAALAAAFAAGCTRDARPTTPQSPGAAEPHAHAPGTAEPGIGRPGEHVAFVDPGADARERRPVVRAIAVLHTPEGRRMGTVSFVDRGREGLDMETTVEGLPGGHHAYHVHVHGDCSSSDFKSAGPHFHFTGSSFDESVGIITGNLGELHANGEGRATHRARIPAARIQGPFSVLGRSVVVHEHGNDPSVTPDGGAGGRIACGVIGVADTSAGAAGQSASR